MNENELRIRLLESLEKQGLKLRDGLIVPYGQDEKAILRRVHCEAVRHQVKRSADGLKRHESWLLSFIASGNEVLPERIIPRLVEVHPNTDDELLFRYARLHWSIPVSPGYGETVASLFTGIGLSSSGFVQDKRSVGASFG